jgi:hypothetical protein
MSINSCVGEEDASMRDALFTWLCPPNAEESYSAAAARRCPGTCLWIFDHPTYQQWIRGGGMLWLQGLGEKRYTCSHRSICRLTLGDCSVQQLEPVKVFSRTP